MAKLKSAYFVFVSNQNISTFSLIIANWYSFVITNTYNDIVLMRTELSIECTIAVCSDVHEILVLRRVEQP